MDKKAIGNRIREIRKEHGYTQLEMSEELEMSYDAYKKIERGVSKIQIDKLMILAQKFDVSVSHILFGERSDFEIIMEQINLLDDSKKLSLLIKLVCYFVNLKNSSFVDSEKMKTLDSEIDEIVGGLKNKGLL